MQNNDLDSKLNKRETYKARLRPIDYFNKEFDTIDYESLGEGDRFYLQDFGIFNTDFLEDEFTMRLRVAGGRLTPTQFKYIAEVIKEYDLFAILTARGGIQLHELQAEDVYDIWKKLNTQGLTTWQSFGDNIRNIVCDVYDGCGRFSEIEVYPIVQQMQDYIVQNPRYVGMLPRRVSIGISGNSASVTSFFANDLYFALAKKDGVVGFNVLMGGKNTEIAKDADIFLEPDEVFDFFKAFVESFYLHGSRYSRSKTRLFYLIKSIGMEGFKNHIKKEFKKEFKTAGDIWLDKVVFEHQERLKDGLYSYCYQTDFARLSADEMIKLSDFAIKNGAEVRIGIDQNIYIIGLKEKQVPFQSPSESYTIVACAGNLCPYAVWSIKNETKYLPLQKINQYGIQVGFSGCAKGCGRHFHTDIGLIGLKTNNFGDTDAGARVFLGAVHTEGLSVGRLIFSMVPLLHLDATLSLIITLFEKSGFDNFELFSHNILNKFSAEFLAIWFLANLKAKREIELEVNHDIKVDTKECFLYETSLLEKHFNDIDLLDDFKANNFKKAISALVKELWTIEGKDPKYKPKLNRVNFR